MSRSWRNGSPPGWRATRAAVLARDAYRCQLRLDDCTTIATTAHHTLGRETGSDDLRYLVAACAPCNSSVGDPRRFDPPPRPRTNWTAPQQ